MLNEHNHIIPGLPSSHFSEDVFDSGKVLKKLAYLISTKRIILFHSRSGLGKTSILSQLIPHIKAKFNVLPVIRVGLLTDEPECTLNRYKLSMLRSLEAFSDFPYDSPKERA